jgi:hypothetical protein
MEEIFPSGKSSGLLKIRSEKDRALISPFLVWISPSLAKVLCVPFEFWISGKEGWVGTR